MALRYRRSRQGFHERVPDRWEMLFGRRKCDAKVRAAPRRALDFDLAVMLSHHLAHDDETQSRAVPALFRRIEGVEDVRAQVVRHAAARVGEFDEDSGPLAAVNSQV